MQNINYRNRDVNSNGIRQRVIALAGVAPSKLLIFMAIFLITEEQLLLISVSFGISNSNVSSEAHSSLFATHKKSIALQLVSSAENGSTDWSVQYAYIEDIKDGRGYTAGIAGFCSSTGDMLKLIQNYTRVKPNNILAKYIPALQQVYGSASHEGLDPNFVPDWKTAARDPVFRIVQDHERDVTYFNPAVNQAKADGLRVLGQFIYFDAMLMHGHGQDSSSFASIRATAMLNAKPPAQGGNESTYLMAFLDARKAVMLAEPAHADTSRIDTQQRVFLQQGNIELNLPLTWHVYGKQYSIS